MGMKVDEKCLIVRNFPVSFSEQDIREFVQMFDAIHVEIYEEQKTAFLEFNDKEHARSILYLLHQEVLEENRLFAEYAPKSGNYMQLLQEPVPDIAVAGPSYSKTDEISESVKRLFATDDNINFNQPPPPYLCYEYPKANRDIIDAIGIALECVPKFYVQVLHLMNRMNLEPPFVPGDPRAIYESSSCKVQYTTASTQTDEIVWQNLVRNKRKLIDSDESELSSDETSECVSSSKRSKFDKNNKHELVKQKQRNMLRMQRLQKQLESIERSQNNQQKVSEAFELDEHQIKSAEIKIVVPDKLSTTEDTSTIIASCQNDDDNDVEHTTCQHTWNDAELQENRIPSSQLAGHPMFQNYREGEISNRLYIKNIAKEVTEDDLRAIYDRYLRGNIRSIDIRLMTTGRMKGQAFVTFEVDEMDESDNVYDIIKKALYDTNGLILKGKPFVVVYGKKK